MKECVVKVGLKYMETISIKISNVSLVVGEVQHILLPDDAIAGDGCVDFAIPKVQASQDCIVTTN